MQTKWRRLYNALATRQNQDQSGDRILGFIRAALSPVRYVDDKATFEARVSGVNAALAFYGLEFREDGRFYRVDKVRTITEAQQRANRLLASLQSRGVHQEVLRFCNAELLENNYFHAVLEASKSVADRLRQKAGVEGDGAKLVDDALSGQAPRVRINNFATESEMGEQRGFAMLLKGLFGTFRNPTAHAPRIEWVVTEEDALDLMTIASYAHRRLDSAKT